MIIQTVNDQTADKAFIVYRNMSGSTINANGAICLDLGTTIDGKSAVAPATASLLGWIGIADRDVADTGYSTAQIFGYRDSILLSHEGSSVTVTAGNALHIINGQFGLTTSTAEALSTVGFKYVICGATKTVSAATYTTGIIRCL